MFSNTFDIESTYAFDPLDVIIPLKFIKVQIKYIIVFILNLGLVSIFFIDVGIIFQNLLNYIDYDVTYSEIFNNSSLAARVGFYLVDYAIKINN
ncbi:MAG: hypothetical protein ACK5HL_00885 [Bacilli bacterium]